MTEFPQLNQTVASTLFSKDSSTNADYQKPQEDNIPQQQQQVNVNGQALRHQQVPLTRCHLQRFDSRRSENVEDYNRNNGYCDYNGFNKNYAKDRYEVITFYGLC